MTNPKQGDAECAPGRLTVGSGPQAVRVPIKYEGAAPHEARRAMIIVHGRRRDAVTYARLAMDAFGRLMPDLLIAAPQFLAVQDLIGGGGEQLAYWGERDWMEGGLAAGPLPIAAFAVLDALCAHLADRTRFPLIDDIVLAGHSAGGQLVHRYAILSPVADDVRFIVANPSSYVWFGPGPGPGPGSGPEPGPGPFRWKYALAGRPAYGAMLDDAAIEARYVGRDMLYLLGARDCDPAHPMLDRSAAAMAQGPHRLARGRAYQAHLAERHGAALRHRWVEVPDVGHDPAGILSATVAQEAIWPAYLNLADHARP
ncbi:MAG TPA: hypothetical protein PLI12_00225 [Acetobacteraceae bacterium]|nr:hypothetical protein [Acetobacteraceae bacterium]HQU00857.1 hypothetical protein [Acetobacteraceae bacterium]